MKQDTFNFLLVGKLNLNYMQKTIKTSKSSLQEGAYGV